MPINISQDKSRILLLIILPDDQTKNILFFITDSYLCLNIVVICKNNPLWDGAVRCATGPEAVSMLYLTPLLLCPFTIRALFLLLLHDRE